MKSRQHISEITFIVLSAVFTSLILFRYSFLLKGIIPGSDLYREFKICFGQIFFQGIILICFKKPLELIIEYLKAMMLVSFIGAIMLLPAFLLNQFISGPFVFIMCFMCVVLVMFVLHAWLVKRVNAPAWLSGTWVLYRFAVLLIII